MALVTSLAMILSITSPILAFSGGGNQVHYPTVNEINNVALIGSNLWIAMGKYEGSSLIWANAETGRWAPQNRSALSVDAYSQDLWVADGSVSLFDGNSWTTWSTWTAGAKGQASQIRVDPTGHPWLLSDSAVSRYNGANWERLVEGPDYPHWANYAQIAPISANEAWVVSTSRGLLHIAGNITETYTTEDGLVSDNMVTVAYDAVNGKVWAGSFYYGISYGDGSNWASLTTSDGLQSNWIEYLEVGNGSTWIAYADYTGTIAKYTAGSGLSHLDLPGPYASSRVTYIRAQAPATLWVGLDNGVVLRYVDAQWTVVTALNGPVAYTVNRVFGVGDKVYSNGWQGTSVFDGSQWQTAPDRFAAGAELGEDNYWLGTSNGYLYHSSDGSEWQKTYLGSDVWVTKIASDTQSSFLWLGTSSGLWQYNPATGTVISKLYPAAEVATPGDYIFDLEVTADGKVWLIASISDAAGTITCFDPATNSWSKFNDDASGMAQTSTGALWFSTWFNWQKPLTSGSLINFDGTSWTVYTQTHGLPWHMVNDVMIDAVDRVWTAGMTFGTAANNWESWSGLSVLDAGKFISYPILQGVSTSAGAWLDLQSGDIWLPTAGSGGILRFNANGLVSTKQILETETSIESPDGSGIAIFPAGVLPEGTEVSIRSTLPENSGSLKGKNSVVEISWEEAALRTTGTYTVTLNYVGPILGIYIPGSLGLYRRDPGTAAWENIALAQHDVRRMEFSAAVSGPGVFQIMGRTYEVFLPLVLRQ